MHSSVEKNQFQNLSIVCNGNKIKRHEKVKCLGCLLNVDLSGESIATYVSKKLTLN